MSIATFSYLAIPVLVYTGLHSHWFLYLVMYGFGWFQAIAWPVLLMLVHGYFHASRDGCLLGFWAANTSVGNIAGFGLCTWLIYFMKLPFQVPLIVAAIISFLTIISIYKLPTPPLQPPKSPQPSSLCSSLSSYLSLLKIPMICLTLIIMCMLKSILYGILLWLPMYFDK
jgi:sugar phosphate permease